MKATFILVSLIAIAVLGALGYHLFLISLNDPFVAKGLTILQVLLHSTQLLCAIFKRKISKVVLVWFSLLVCITIISGQFIQPSMAMNEMFASGRVVICSKVCIVEIIVYFFSEAFLQELSRHTHDS